MPLATTRRSDPRPDGALRGSTAKEGTDLLDIGTILLDAVARHIALAQLARCDPLIAADAARIEARPVASLPSRTARECHSITT